MVPFTSSITGSTDMDTIENRIRYMKHGLGRDVFDHVSI